MINRLLIAFIAAFVALAPPSAYADGKTRASRATKQVRAKHAKPHKAKRFKPHRKAGKAARARPSRKLVRKRSARPRTTTRANLKTALSRGKRPVDAKQRRVVRAMEILKNARRTGKPLSRGAQKIVREALTLVEEGTTVPGRFEPLPKPGFGVHQTYLSMADPGPGHINTTFRSAELMDGLVGHMEIIDRPNDKVSPYNMPDPIMAAQGRMVAGDDAPVSIYLGRPNYLTSSTGGKLDPVAVRFDNDSQQAINTTAHMASSAFVSGIADVKIAMDGLTTRQAVKLMNGISRRSMRSKGQTLAAAFNLNTPVIDDRATSQLAIDRSGARLAHARVSAVDVRDSSGGYIVRRYERLSSSKLAQLRKRGVKNIQTYKLVRDPYQIARLALSLTKRGGFDKIAWDGAGNDNVTSGNFLELLGTSGESHRAGKIETGAPSLMRGRRRLLTLVHEAHSQGLMTYISAGMKDTDMYHAAAAGVDGVGVGTWLHDESGTPGIRGEINTDRVKSALEYRNKGQASIWGQGAKRLAQLDTLHAQGKLSPAEARIRKQLFKAMATRDHKTVSRIAVAYPGASSTRVNAKHAKPDVVYRTAADGKPRRGWYEGADDRRNSKVTVRHISAKTPRRIPRIVDPKVDGTMLVKNEPAKYNKLLEAADGSLTPDEFFAEIEKTVPDVFLKKVDRTIAKAKKAYARGLADRPPPTKAWRREMILSYLHSRDVAMTTKALGYGRAVEGVHDLNELVPARDLKRMIKRTEQPAWFVRYVNGLHPDQMVNVGFLNPNLAASMYNWGDGKHEVQGAMDAHRNSNHHDGNSDQDKHWVEWGVNAALHHNPAEHQGIQHRPYQGWDMIEDTLANDPALQTQFGKTLIRDAATMLDTLSREGKAIPWQKMKRPRGVDFDRFERAYSVAQKQVNIGRHLYRKASKQVRSSKATPKVRTRAQNLLARVRRLKQAGDAEALTRDYLALRAEAAGTSNAADVEVAESLGQAIAGQYASLGVTDQKRGNAFLAELNKVSPTIDTKATGLAAASDLQGAASQLGGFDDAARRLLRQGDSAQGELLRDYAREWRAGFPWKLEAP